MTELMDRSAPAAAFDAFVGAATETSRLQRGPGPRTTAPSPRCSSATGHPRCSTTPAGSTSCSAGRRRCPSRAASSSCPRTGSPRRWPSRRRPPSTPLVYDFGGFHPRYYSMTYETPDAGALARQVAATVPDGTSLHEHPSRGLDHGAWVPLKVMYPLGDVPGAAAQHPHRGPHRAARPRPPAAAVARRGRARHRFRLHDARPAVPHPGDVARRGGPLVVGGLRRVGRRRPGPRRPRHPRRLQAGARACRTPTRAPSTTCRCSSPSARPTTPNGRSTRR